MALGCGSCRGRRPARDWPRRLRGCRKAACGRRRSPARGGMAETVVFVWIVASVCEEVFYRGLLQGVLAPLAGVRMRIGNVVVSLPVGLCGIAVGGGALRL